MVAIPSGTGDRKRRRSSLPYFSFLPVFIISSGLSAIWSKQLSSRSDLRENPVLPIPLFSFHRAVVFRPLFVVSSPCERFVMEARPSAHLLSENLSGRLGDARFARCELRPSPVSRRARSKTPTESHSESRDIASERDLHIERNQRNDLRAVAPAEGTPSEKRPSPK